MKKDNEIISKDDIAEIIWKHIYASCKYDWYSSNDNEYYPVEWAATEIYKLFNPTIQAKIKFKIYKGNVKPDYITPYEQAQRNVIYDLERKLEVYMHKVKRLENYIKNSEKQAKIRNESFITKLFECFKDINYITVNQCGLNLYKNEPNCINTCTVGNNDDTCRDTIYLGYNYSMKDFPIKSSRKFKNCKDCCYCNQKECGVRLYFRGDFL